MVCRKTVSTTYIVILVPAMRFGEMLKKSGKNLGTVEINFLGIWHSLASLDYQRASQMGSSISLLTTYRWNPWPNQTQKGRPVAFGVLGQFECLSQHLIGLNYTLTCKYHTTGIWDWLPLANHHFSDVTTGGHDQIRIWCSRKHVQTVETPNVNPPSIINSV